MNPERIKLLRKQNGYTQVELSKKLGIGVSTVAMWETGKRTPNYNILCKLSDLYDRTIEYILGNSDDDRSVKLNENEIEQLGKWELENAFSDIFKMYLSLDNYGKANVDALIHSERLRCIEQGTLDYKTDIKVLFKTISHNIQDN